MATNQKQLSLPKHKDWILPLLSTILQTEDLASTTSSINLDSIRHHLNNPIQAKIRRQALIHTTEESVSEEIDTNSKY